MAKECSFDVVSRVSLPEVDNAIQMARREVGTRFDFKNTNSSIEQNELVDFLLIEDPHGVDRISEIPLFVEAHRLHQPAVAQEQDRDDTGAVHVSSFKKF